MDEGAIMGQPNYIIFYGEGCFNSKRQARRTVSLYQKYRGRVHFVIVDLDLRHSAVQQDLVKKYYQGAIPHVTILDKNGKAIYDRAGEVDESKIANLLDEALK
jgi:thioredoxin-related protein